MFEFLQGRRELLDRMFGIDVRALAVFRIGIGLILLYDLFTRAWYLEPHYTDFGVLPRADLIRLGAGVGHEPWYFSLHFLSGELWWQGALFVVAAACAVLLTIGWRTSWMAVASWLLLLSVQARNPLVLQGGDVLLRVLLFWSLPLPLGAVWSVDRWRRRAEAPPASRVLNVSSAALLGQVIVMYFFTGFMKSDGIWVRDGTAIFYALQLDAFTTAWGAALAEHRDWCRWLTFAALYLERYGAWLALVPWFHTPLRLLTVMAFWGLHLGLIATMQLGHFPYLCILAWVLFLPTPFWNALTKCAGPTTATGHSLPSVAVPSWRTKIANVIVPPLFLLIVLWNLRLTWPERYKHTVPAMLEPIVLTLRLDQSWGMFAPYPLIDDGWFVMTGTLVDGRQIDLWDPGKPPSIDKPDMRHFYPHERWRKYFFNLWQVDFKAGRGPLLHWLARRWNRDYAHAPDQICTRVELDFWLEKSTEGPPLPWEELKLLTVDIE